ncbi:MAG: tRNA glutamyl-Q(34) synthetase GluQRS, partial [Myxococcales bacterium]|nr:tRNA glutamyl-Q(34) synthetase GluQRS [Myxococcales bacterium]
DGAWAYQLAVVVDDAAMAIDEVVRGADLLGNTPRQALLQQALALPRPRYLHVPLVLGDDGEKLSKRHRAPDLGALREAGVSPRRVIAALAASVGLVPRACRELDARALVDVYAPSRLVGGRVDLEALR